MILVLGTGAAFASDNDISLKVDGNIVKTDVSPIIKDGRTLVPYRALLEALGGEVSWDSETQTATAKLGNDEVQVTIDSTSGLVNGIKKTLEVPAQIIDGRTLIPVRFVLENLKCSVDWDNEARTVMIESPSNSGLTEISSVTVEETDTSYRIVASANKAIQSTKAFSLDNPERFGVDIENASFPDGKSSIDTDNKIFSSVRFSQFDDSTVRIVVDLNQDQTGQVTLSDDKSTLYIDFAKGNTDTTTGNDDTDTDVSGLPELNSLAAEKLVVLDAGHGGADQGSSSVYNGKTIKEKDLNLAVAKRLYELLSAAGADVKLLRDSDVSMGLQTRPQMANALGADLFISIHNNWFQTDAVNGTEVHYDNKTGENDNYGITSKELAAFLQQEMVSAVGFADRGIKSSPELAVLNGTVMPAAIIEGGFLSNPDNLAYMVTDEYTEEYAQAAAKGIIEALNSTVD